jgi:hypothetical protein
MCGHQVGSYVPDMTANNQPPDPAEREPVSHYEIRVKGQLAPRWSAWFDGMTIETDADADTTAIRGPVVDQAALHGLIQKLRDVGIPLLSLVRLRPDIPTEPPAHQTQKEK